MQYHKQKFQDPGWRETFTFRLCKAEKKMFHVPTGWFQIRTNLQATLE
jgi:hypothetical protein